MQPHASRNCRSQRFPGTLLRTGPDLGKDPAAFGRWGGTKKSDLLPLDLPSSLAEVGHQLRLLGEAKGVELVAAPGAVRACQALAELASESEATVCGFWEPARNLPPPKKGGPERRLLNFDLQERERERERESTFHSLLNRSQRTFNMVLVRVIGAHLRKSATIYQQK